MSPPSPQPASTSKPSKSRTAGRSYGGTSASERVAERRRKLIEAGLEVIGSVGYHAATVRAICAAAGLTERYFYESFENSEGLLCAVYAQLIADLQQRTGVALLQADRDPEALARAALRVYYEVNRDPRVARLTLFEILGVSKRVDRLYSKAMDDFAALIRGVVQSLKPTGGRDADLDQELLSAGLVGAAVQIARRWVLDGYAQPLDAVVASAHAIFAAVNRQAAAARTPVQGKTQGGPAQ